MEENWDDYDFVMEQVSRSAWQIKLASEEMRNNIEIVSKAIQQDGRLLEYASEELRDNYEIVMQAVKQNGHALKYASEELRDNYEIVMQAVKQNGHALRYASEDMQDNYEIVMEAVKQNGEALRYASEDMQDNYEIVMEAIKQNGLSIKYASKALRENTDVVTVAINENIKVLLLISDYIKEEMIKKIEDPELSRMIVLSIRDTELLKKYMIGEKNKYDKIGIPFNMTFGIEIETEGENAKMLSTLKSSRGYWDITIDITLDSDGVEVVSPILTDNKEDIEEIYLMCKKHKELGRKVNQRCGGHVHIGADYLTSKEAYENLYEIWGNAEEIILKICNEKGDLLRQGVKQWAGSVAYKVNDAIENESINIESENDLNDFLDSLKEIQEKKYVALNLQNVNSSKNTIEFRVSNGTINPDTWIENIRLYGRIVQMSEKIALIEKNDKATEEEKQIVQLKEKLKEDIPETEKMEVLLDMLFSEEEKDVYRQRYNETIKMIKQNPQNKYLFNLENVVVDFKKKKKEKVEFKELASKEKQSDIQKVEEDFITEIERGLEQESDIER